MGTYRFGMLKMAQQITLTDLINSSDNFFYKIKEEISQEIKDNGETCSRIDTTDKQKIYFCDENYMHDVMNDIRYISNTVITNMQEYALARDEIIELDQSLGQKLEGMLNE